MKTKPRKRLGLQLLAISLISVIFTWLYLANVGNVNKVVVFNNATDAFWNLPTEINLPFAANKIVNTLLVIAFCYVIIGVVKYLNRPKHRSNDAIVGIIYGLLFGLITGAWLMVAGTINHHVELAFGSGLLLVSLIGIVATLEDSVLSGLKLSLATALTTGVVVGMMVGLKTNFSVGFFASITIAAIVVIVSGGIVISIGILKFLFSRKTWGGFFNLLNGLSFND